MKIIHCADLHLDSAMETHLTEKLAKERRMELLHTFCRMVEYGDQQGVCAILIAGDLYDGKLLSKVVRNTIYRVIKDHPQIAFYYLRGNHDAASFLTGMEEIPENLFTFTNEWRSYRLNPKGTFPVCLTAAEFSGDNWETLYSSLSLCEQDYNLVMLHGQAAEYAKKDGQEQVVLSFLRQKGIDYLALGHIHSYQEGFLDARGVYCYPGCLEGRGFDETGRHGFVLLDLDEKTRICHRTFIPFAKRQLFSITVDITGCMSSLDVVKTIKEQLTEPQETDLVKITLLGELEEESEINLDFLYQEWEQEFYYLLICDQTKWKTDLSRLSMERSMKGEYVRTVLEEPALTEEERALLIRYGLKALMGEEIE